MALNIERLIEIVGNENVITDIEELESLYCSPFLDGLSKTPLASVLPENTNQVSNIIKYLNSIGNINVVIISSRTNPKYLNDTIISDNSLVLDLSRMNEISFINKRNKVCVVEPGVTWFELGKALKREGLRPLAPFMVRSMKSALASVLDREPHLIAKKQFDISDPLLCMEVVFGNGEVFRTGEAAGPLSIEENRKAGAALTNPLGPGQTDIFRIIQGAKGTLGCATWISMQCDLIPSKRVIKVIQEDNLPRLTEFVYRAVKMRLIDEVFIVNNILYNSLFPNDITIKKFILVFAINGYEWLPDEKVAYQTADVGDLMGRLFIDTTNVNKQTYNDLEAILDGVPLTKHPKDNLNKISLDIIYNTTLNRINDHLNSIEIILDIANFPLERLNVYIQPIIQARAVNVEISLMADKPSSSSKEFLISRVKEICKEVADNLSESGVFFSRSYPLINDYIFTNKNLVQQESLRKLKKIFDPNKILNRGQLIF